MATKSKHQIAKQTAIWNKEKRSLKRKADYDYVKLDELSQIKIQIAKYQSDINNCNSDLNGMFKNNETIRNKRNIMIQEQDKLKNKMLVLEKQMQTEVIKNDN